MDKVVKYIEKVASPKTPIDTTLRTIALDPKGYWKNRSEAAKLLLFGGDREITQDLLNLFAQQEDQVALWQTALTLENLKDLRAVPHLIAYLNDSNVHRRHGAARALGWIGKAGNRAADALAAVLADPSQPLTVREEAAESLGYLEYRRTLPVLIAALSAPEVQIRFWSVFSLGKFLCPDYKTIDPGVASALEKMLFDDAVAPGQNYWSVGREALAMLGDPANKEYASRLKQEIERVAKDPAASEEDRRWADFYG